MPYATFDDASAIYGRGIDQLLSLKDGQSVEDAWAQRLGAASSRVDGYLAKAGYETPIDLAALRGDAAAVPPVEGVSPSLAAQITEATALMALMAASVGSQDARKSLQEAYKAQVEWLRNLAKNLPLPRIAATSDKTFGAVPGTGKPQITGAWHALVRRGLGQ
ncbi:MAG: hypothetical protein AAGM22_22720 [Acidobacteriota bacterium]